MKNILIISLLCLIGCKKPIKQWQFEKELKLNNVYPIGGAILNDEIWLADGDGNRLVKIDDNGAVIDEVRGLERPMHIDAFGNTLLVPEYGKDVISTYTNKVRDSIKGLPELDAPAGVFKYKKELAIADFYNSVVHYYDGVNWLKIGKKGKELGEFNYPTDVQITSEHIYVADAYNHRVQVFNKNGKFKKVIALNEGINAATGLLVFEKNIFITDFENNRVLIFSKDGELHQVIASELTKPTDVLIYKKKLYVLNFKSSSISVFVKN